MASVADEVAELRGTGAATLKDLLTQPAFSRLLAAMTVSSLGDWVGFVAVTSLVASISGSKAGLAVGGVMIVRMLPAVLFGPIAGVFVDRFDRKKVMIASDLARGALFAAMAFMSQLWLIYLFSFVKEGLSLLWTPARDASLPNMVPRRQLANANAISLVSTYATLPLGCGVFAVLAAFSDWISARVPWVLGRPESPHGHLGLEFLQDARLVQVRIGQRCRGVSGGDAVDADVATGPLDGHHLDELVHPSLARSIETVIRVPQHP